MSISYETAELLLNQLRTELNDGFLYLFSGPVPATADEALDMVNDHTQLVRMTESGDGSTGLSFETPVQNVMVKAAAEDWSGLVAFDGAEDNKSTLTPTFYRFCSAGDDGRAAATAPRLQGTVGGPTSNADFVLTSGDSLTDNGTNTQGASFFRVILDA